MARYLSRFFLIPILSSLIFVSAAYADGDSSNGKKTGKSTVSLRLEKKLSITDVSDITFNLTGEDTGQNQSAYDAVCIYSNDLQGKYSIKATTKNGSFILKSNTASIPYKIFWNDSDTPGGKVLVYNTSKDMNGASQKIKCGGTPNARFTIKIAGADTAGKPSGRYSDTVTFILSGYTV